MIRLPAFTCALAAGFGLLAGVGCRRDTALAKPTTGLDEFIPIYNRYIHRWLLEQETAAKEEIAKNATALSNAH